MVNTHPEAALAMTGLAAFALANAVDVAFFTPPPGRPSRPERGRASADGGVIGLVRSLRQAIAIAVEEPAAPWMPSVSRNYPY
jgi:hypothetical protein